MKTKALIISGDPIIDIYIKEKDGLTLSYDERYGGALNVLRNAESVLGSYSVLFLPNFRVTNRIGSLYKILRLNCKKPISFCTVEKKKNYYKEAFDNNCLNYISQWFSSESGLILSDYNKGILNSNALLNTKDFNKLRFLVVDSRYRSINLNYLKLANKTFWRCTGQEYEKEFAKNFDYTIWTDAEKPVKLLDRNQDVIDTISFCPVSKEQVVDTCGAGDTFTAAFSSYLFNEDTISIEIIKDAILFSIDCCQEVVQLDKTSTTSKTIKNFIEKEL